MNFWSILGIEPTNNLKDIKRAYAKQSKVYHPEDDLSLIHIQMCIRDRFMTDRPQIVVQANFSQVIIRVPKDWQVDTHGLHTSLAGVKGYDGLGERELSSTTVSLTGSVSFGQVTIKH